MELWVGPVILAAVVSALVNVAGWFVTFRQSMKLEQHRRDEKVHDFQVALRAEISSDLLNLDVVDWQAYLRDITSRYAADPDYSVVVPHMASNAIFTSVVTEIHILPGQVIAPVVNYARLRETVERFVLDLRAERYSQLSGERQLVMYSDYLRMLARLEALAEHAVAAIDRSLGVSTLDAVRSNQVSASELASEAARGAAGERGEP
ncbi:MAG: hypothetical protein Q8L54_09260 [Devosia sp.]|nr:hypothetical protein [Devosia sp.]